MANLYKSSVHSQSIITTTTTTTTTTGTPHLPNELLLDILLQVAQRSSRSLPTLYRINRHWYHLIKRYEPLLWKTATLATFPDVTLPDRDGEGSGSQAARWKRVYGIHLGWVSRKAQVLLVKPQRPEPRSTQSVSLTPFMMTSQQQQQQQPLQMHGHVHDHHQLALLEHHGQHVAVGLDDRDHGHASSSSSSLHPHEPPMVIHSTAASSSLCRVMNEAIVSHGSCLDHNHDSSSGGSSSNNSHGRGKDGSHAHSFTVDPQHDDENEEEEEDTLSCSLCTYADLCLVPQLQICVRVHRNRNRPLMQVLDWSLQQEVELEGGVENHHQDLISGTAVNDSGTMMASCSIDGTVRVWDLNQAFAVVAGHDQELHPHSPSYQGTSPGEAFLDKVERWGCPIKCRWLLTGHVGWVNAVAIEETTVVSGGSDHTVRVWDALTGTLKYLIPDLYTSRPELGLGVYAVAIHGQSVIGSGSVMEGYQLHDLSTGELIFELDEPLSSRDHVQFENELYQQYASRIAITDTVVVTNSKMEGMLCVWSRQTGELMYRIHASSAAVGGSGQDAGLSRARWRGQQQQKEPGREEVQGGRLVTFEASESSLRIRMEGVAAAANAASAAAAAVGIHGEEETVHTFKINKSGSMLMCTLCDGRATLIEFGRMRRTVNESSWVVEASGHGSLLAQADVQRVEHQRRQEHSHHCGALAWAWTRTRQGRNRVVLV
ncbi:unnamed protein product [Mortierella alpina]